MSHPLHPHPTTAPAAVPAVPGWPAATAPLTGPVELAADRPPAAAEAVVWVPGAQGQMVPVTRETADVLLSAVPATPARDLTPPPLLDARAQRLLAAGVGTGAAAAGAGWGLGQVIAPLAALTGSGLLWAVCLAAVALAARRPRTTTTYVTNTASWWGRTTTTH
ncbi:hypothetical protein [Streptomyces chumphonensis]|uniref:hypothetical protein n=1 Tax=Streptomyces chumphonensis TaxID=1214925 RepID=UPI003D747855